MVLLLVYYMRLEETIMKLTKIMALAVVLVMLVAAFAACGGDPVDTTPDTTPEPETTKAPETTEPETTECQHKNTLRKTGMDKASTCTEGGYIERMCTVCGYINHEPIEKIPHAYNEMNSIDGKYHKKACTICLETVVTDQSGNVVADVAGITFPIFAVDFSVTNTLAEVSALFAGFKAVEAGTFGNIVTTNPNGERYINVPTGNYGANKNGRFELTDENKALAGGFTIKFDSQYADFPKDKTPLLTWIVDGQNYVILSVDKNGHVYNSADEKICTSKDKGWDSFEVVVKADGSYTVSMDGVAVGTGTTATAVKSSSAIKFFDNSSEFEGYLDNIVIHK